MNVQEAYTELHDLIVETLESGDIYDMRRTDIEEGIWDCLNRNKHFCIQKEQASV